jgi:shikimate dehydrogenase
MEYGLIGEHLGHSYSKMIHESFGKYSYELKEIEKENIDAFLASKDFKAINVTVPYKLKALESADKLDASAKMTNSANCLVNRNGKVTAYNTDISGIAYTFEKHNIDVQGKKVVILGDGGVAQTFKAYLKDKKAGEILSVYYKSKPGTISYEELKEKHKDAQVLINATPVGTAPNLTDCPLDLNGFDDLEFVFDVIYNPSQTALLLQAQKKNIPFSNGLWMLIVQAKVAAEYFLGESLSDDSLDALYNSILCENLNLVLIGMPSSGKTTIGSMAAKKLSRPFVDADKAIENEQNCTIAHIFEEQGEAGFRALEKEMMARLAKAHGTVISCGGGVVLDPDNMDILSQNGLIVYLQRDLQNLVSYDPSRPMLVYGLENLYNLRKPMYEGSADVIIDNNHSITQTLNDTISALENLEGASRLK